MNNVTTGFIIFFIALAVLFLIVVYMCCIRDRCFHCRFQRLNELERYLANFISTSEDRPTTNSLEENSARNNYITEDLPQQLAPVTNNTLTEFPVFVAGNDYRTNGTLAPSYSSIMLHEDEYTGNRSPLDEPHTELASTDQYTNNNVTILPSYSDAMLHQEEYRVHM